MKTAELSVSVRNSEKGAIIVVGGELDLTTVVQLRDVLMAQVSQKQSDRVVVDLTAVDFIDSAGLALLVEARKPLSSESRTLYLVIAQGKQPERVLRLVRFETIMKLIYSLDDIPADSAPS